MASCSAPRAESRMFTSAAGSAAWADCCVAQPASRSTAPADRVVRLAAVRKDRRGSRMAVSDISLSLVLVGAWLRLMQAKLRRSPERGAEDRPAEIGRAHVLTPVTNAQIVC